jgi:hypothetical protein
MSLSNRGRTLSNVVGRRKSFAIYGLTNLSNLYPLNYKRG